MGWLFCEPTRDALVRRLKDRCNNDSYELIDSAPALVTGNITLPAASAKTSLKKYLDRLPPVYLD